jgi:hypothetical protein
MKPSSPRRNRKPLSPATARNAALINQLATPGLGTLMAGRLVVGIGQLILALAGFGFIVVWFVSLLRQYYGLITGDAPVTPVTWVAQAGAGLFLAAWCWSLVTSISLMREARRNAPAVFAAMPPPLIPQGPTSD